MIDLITDRGFKVTCEIVLTGCKNAERKAHSDILIGEQEEQAINQNSPDGNVGQDPRRESVSMDSRSSVPVQGNKVPGEWPTDNWEVDEGRSGRVAEISSRQVGEIDN